MIEMKVKHPINGSITPFRNNAIDAIMCCHGVSETRSEKTGKWEDEGATSSFWHRNAHSERNMNTNDNGMQCDGHATKNQLPQCQWTFSCGNIWIVNASTFICFNVLVLALSLSHSPNVPYFFTLCCAAFFQCEPIIAEPLFSIFKHCIWIELIDAHSMSCPFNIRIDRKLRIFFTWQKAYAANALGQLAFNFANLARSIHIWFIHIFFKYFDGYFFLLCIVFDAIFFHCIPSGQVVCTQWQRCFFSFHSLRFHHSECYCKVASEYSHKWNCLKRRTNWLKMIQYYRDDCLIVCRLMRFAAVNLGT